MNEIKSCEIHFCTVTIAPGQLFQLVGGRLGSSGKTDCVPVELVVDCSSTFMIINFLRAGGRDLLASRSALPVGPLGRTAFSPCPIEENVELSLGVTNLSDSPQNFTAVLLLEKVVSSSATGSRATGPSIADDELRRILDEERSRPEDLHLESQTLESQTLESQTLESQTLESQTLEDEEPGVLARCWGWFKQGIAVAMTDHTLAADRSSLSDLVRPARAHDSLRRLVSDFVDVAEIPLMAAMLYWKQIADLAHRAGEQEVAIPSTVGFGPEVIERGSTRKLTIDIIVPMRLRRLRLDPAIATRLRIIDVMTEKDSLLLSLGPIPGIFGVEGIDIGSSQIAYRSVSIVIENVVDTDVEVRGVLDGNRVSRAHE
jgi:hypothetical protein